MIFFVAMPLVIGLMNFAVPLQLGARDVAFPGAQLGQLLADRHRRAAGQSCRSSSASSRAPAGCAYPPLSGLAYSPDVGVDYYLWSLQISGVGTLLTGVNFVTTILKLRAPGMTYLHMPVFCWTTLATNLLIVAAFPILTATLAMLLLDRYLGFAFLHQRRRRQPDDVREPHLDLGPSRGLHPGPAGLRHLLGGVRHLLRQAAVRLPLDGLRRRWGSASSPSWSGCTISSPWARAPTSMRSSASPR